MTPVFEIFNLIGSLFYGSSRLTPLSAENFGSSLSHLVLEILGPTFFKDFCINYLLDFRSFLTPYVYKTLHPIGSNFLSCADPSYQKFGIADYSI